MVNMLEQINKLIGESDTEILAGLYTNIFYSCFEDTFVSGFYQSAKTSRLRKITKDGYVEVTILVESNLGTLPDRPSDSNKFYELLNIVGGNREMAKISPIIQFKVLPKNFLDVDRWLNNLSNVSIQIDIKSNVHSNKESVESFSIKDLKIIESYQVENLSVAKTASGSVVDVSSKNPAIFTVNLSDWIVEALSKNYLRLSIMDKLLYHRASLPIV